MIYYQIQTHEGESVAGNINEFRRLSEFKNRKTFSLHSNGKGVRGVEVVRDDFIIWFVVEDEEALLKSGKLFQRTLDFYGKAAYDLLAYQKQKLTAHGHTLTTIQSQIRQRIDVFADDAHFYGEKYVDSVANIALLIKEDPESAADLICYIHKRIADMRAHLLGVQVIHMGSQFEVKSTQVSLRRAILNQCTPFLKELEEKSIEVRFFFSDSHEVDVDKNMFSLVMYNFFSNAVKYTKPTSEIRFNYSPDEKSLDVSMISLKMEKDEIADLSKETVRGRHAVDIPGNGVGLFVLQKALGLMGKERMYISPDYTKVYPDGNRSYVENHFWFSL